jgi:hypothetical protein
MHHPRRLVNPNHQDEYHHSAPQTLCLSYLSIRGGSRCCAAYSRSRLQSPHPQSSVSAGSACSDAQICSPSPSVVDGASSFGLYAPWTGTLLISWSVHSPVRLRCAVISSTRLARSHHRWGLQDSFLKSTLTITIVVMMETPEQNLLKRIVYTLACSTLLQEVVLTQKSLPPHSISISSFECSRWGLPSNANSPNAPYRSLSRLKCTGWRSHEI